MSSPDQFLTGGSDGIVNLFKIKHDREARGFILERLSGFQLSELDRGLPVQSLVFSENHILAGCQNGDIYRLDRAKVSSTDCVRESREYIQAVFRCWDEEEYFKVELSSDS